jgi:hypothetical protein
MRPSCDRTGVCAWKKLDPSREQRRTDLLYGVAVRETVALGADNGCSVYRRRHGNPATDAGQRQSERDKLHSDSGISVTIIDRDLLRLIRHCLPGEVSFGHSESGKNNSLPSGSSI